MPTANGMRAPTAYAWARAPSPHSPTSAGSYAGTWSDCAAWKTTAPNANAASSRIAPDAAAGTDRRTWSASPPTRSASQRPATRPNRTLGERCS